MVTAPISKAAIHAAGYDFPGHTELLAERCGTEKVVMMLAGERLKVCLVTTHLALRQVPQPTYRGGNPGHRSASPMPPCAAFSAGRSRKSPSSPSIRTPAKGGSSAMRKRG